MKKKNIIITIAVVCGLLVVAGITYAAITLNLFVSNSVYNTKTACFNIDYSIANGDGTSNISGLLFPGLNAGASEGLKGKVSMKINSSCSGVRGIGSLYLHLNELSGDNLTNELKLMSTVTTAHCEDNTTLQTLNDYTTESDCNLHGGAWVTSTSALKYAIYDNNTASGIPLKTGTISSSTTNTDILLYDYIPVTSTNKNLYVFIWLDGYLTDNTYTNLAFSGYIKASATQVKKPVSFATDSWSTVVAYTDSAVYKVGDTREIALTGFDNSGEYYIINHDACMSYLGTFINDEYGEDADHVCSLGENDLWYIGEFIEYYGYTEEELIDEGVITNATAPSTYTIRIANKSKPSDCNTTGFSQTACGFVIEFEDVITTHNMNSTSTNAGGWPATSMRSYVNNDIYNALPTEIKNSIINTYVVSGHGSGDTSGSLANNNFGSTDKLYLLSGKEVWNSTSYDKAAALSRQLDYYYNLGVTTSNYASAIKKLNGSAKWWWLRPAYSYNTRYFLDVDNDGSLYYGDANYTGGVVSAFRVG